jgi:hypothetical protein
LRLRSRYEEAPTPLFSCVRACRRFSVNALPESPPRGRGESREGAMSVGASRAHGRCFYTSCDKRGMRLAHCGERGGASAERGRPGRVSHSSQSHEPSVVPVRDRRGPAPRLTPRGARRWAGDFAQPCSPTHHAGECRRHSSSHLFAEIRLRLVLRVSTAPVFGTVRAESQAVALAGSCVSAARAASCAGETAAA